MRLMKIVICQLLATMSRSPLLSSSCTLRIGATMLSEEGHSTGGCTPPPVRTTSQHKTARVVGFTTSPSSVLRTCGAAGTSADDSPPSVAGAPLESPLAAALRRERSVPALPSLRLKVGAKPLGMARSKSHSSLAPLGSGPAPMPAAAKQPRSATSSPHAASSGGSEPVRIPFG